MASALLAMLTLTTMGARAQAEDAVSLDVGGYISVLSGVHRSGVEGLGEGGPWAGLAQTVARVDWKLTFGDWATLELHNRLGLTVTRDGRASSVGLGVTAAPARWVDLRSALLEDGGTTLDHDLDRLAFRLFVGEATVTLGRQAITWGTSNLFAVADAWATFSPFDLDTSQKRGVDAVRLELPFSDRVEADFVIADRGSLGDLSGGARVSLYLPDGDAYAAVAKQWSQLALSLGGALALDTIKLRADGWLGWDTDREVLTGPRATLGIDWFGADVTWTLEAHHNGTGADATADYLSHSLSEPAYARGEVYMMGRWYGGAAVHLKLDELVQLSIATIVNLTDPSVLITTTLRYDMAENSEIIFGMFNGLGATSDLANGRLESELGSVGHLFFIQARMFF